MNRKRFLNRITYAGLGLTAIGFSSCRNDVKKEISAKNAKKPFFKLSLAQWSIHNMIAKGEISPYSFAEIAKKWGFEGLEYVNSLYQDIMKSTNKNEELKSFVSKNNALALEHNLNNLLIMIDDEGNLSDSNKSARVLAIENHKPWVEAASKMGCHSIRVNLHGSTNNIDAWKETSKESLTELSDFAMNYKINIIVENHGGFSSNADFLMEVINGVNKENCGTLPDFGNFCISGKWGSSSGECDNEYDKYLGVKKLMPKAFAVSAKSYDFDDEGYEKNIDYKRMLDIVKAANYSGYIGVEYEGSRLSEKNGTIATKDLLLKIE
tara:strand:- start:26180 stop:27148 length:969 start_codon:yes stop_codon:yes gene_type:complete